MSGVGQKQTSRPAGREGGFKSLGSGGRATPPACCPLLSQGGAIDALKTYRETAESRPLRRWLAVRIVLPAQRTIPFDYLAWPRKPP
jgi:hypothetical protein